MDAVEFLMEQHRMCNFLGDCEVCDLNKENCCYICDTKEKSEKAVAIVEKWSREHPKKNRMSEFLKNYPNAHINPINGFPTINPCTLDRKLHTASICTELGCAECKEQYWTEEVK